MARLIVFEAGVLIAHLSPADAFHGVATSFMEEHVGEEFAASALTIAECLLRPAIAGRTHVVLQAFDKLSLVGYELQFPDAARLAEIRADTGLRMPDAVVLFTAETHGGEVVTTGAALERAARQRGIPAHLLSCGAASRLRGAALSSRFLPQRPGWAGRRCGSRYAASPLLDRRG